MKAHEECRKVLANKGFMGGPNYWWRPGDDQTASIEFDGDHYHIYYHGDTFVRYTCRLSGGKYIIYGDDTELARFTGPCAAIAAEVYIRYLENPSTPPVSESDILPRMR
jgi:hypothetical protein